MSIYYLLLMVRWRISIWVISFPDSLLKPFMGIGVTALATLLYK